MDVESDLRTVLEHSLRPETWKSYVVTQKEEEEDRRLSYILIEGGRFTPPSDVHRLSKEVLLELGVRGYLDQLLTCDPLVIEALRRFDNIDHILVGTVETDIERVTELLSQIVKPEKALTLVTPPSIKLIVERSRYVPHDVQVVSFVL